ncbi:hypothetical protein [Paraburkholderia hospita]|uniref:hypothetical protein n=1 Tax=Paraburkholderia hospita TaxID=169430 RepID=UPI00140530F0|nr:hypothetical protein [Paraburkholderia hospita]
MTEPDHGAATSMNVDIEAEDDDGLDTPVKLRAWPLRLLSRDPATHPAILPTSKYLPAIRTAFDFEA